MDMETTGTSNADLIHVVQQLERKVDNLHIDLSKALKILTTSGGTEERRNALMSDRSTSDEVHIKSNQIHTANDDENAASPICSSRGHVKRPLKRSTHDHKQICLKKALQMNIVKIIDNIHFAESELQDMLISSECMTEDETNAIKKQSNRKDQVRHLMRLVKGRSYGVMNKFLDCLKQTNSELTDEIWSTYRDILRDKTTNKTVCTFCNLKQSVDLRLIADHLWAASVITDHLYDDIVIGSSPLEELWSRLSKECSSISHIQKATDIVCAALNAKGHYEELSEKIRRKGKLECWCPSTMDRRERTRIRFIPGRLYRSVEACSTASPGTSTTSGDSMVSSILSSEREHSAIFVVDEDENCELSDKLAHYELDLMNFSFNRNNTM